MQINASSWFPTLRARLVSDSNAAHICIKDLLDIGFSFSQASLFVKYFAGNDDEVACKAAAARVRDLILLFLQPHIALAATAFKQGSSDPNIDEDFEKCLDRVKRYT